MTENFNFTPKLKRNLFYMMGAGVVGLLVLFLYPHNHFARLWANILANTYFFTGIGLFGLFVVAATQLAYAGWATLEKRIFLSLSAFARYGGFALALILALGIFGVHSLYDPVTHIVHAGVTETTANKVIYFSTAFWIGRVVFYAILWLLFSVAMNRFFARTDQTNPAVYKRSKLLAAGFIVVFAVTESAISWDMIMSLDPHWYSTMFGWYNFASYGCAAWAMTILIVIFLKSQGYLAKVNENHVHDLGKFLFGFSILWTYMWFDQFMLQWYANIPEETHFWIKRFDVTYFQVTIWGSLVINFLFPLLFLIKRGAKRNFKMIGFGAALLIFGHYIDFFNYTFVESNWNPAAAGHHGAAHEEKAMNTATTALYAEVIEKKEGTTSDVTPATNHEATGEAQHEGATHENGAATTGTHESAQHAATTTEDAHGEHGHEAKAAHGGHGHVEIEKNFAGIGIGEILVFIGFLGLFLFLFFQNLAKRPIVPENDPYLKEAEQLTVTYA